MTCRYPVNSTERGPGVDITGLNIAHGRPAVPFAAHSVPADKGREDPSPADPALCAPAFSRLSRLLCRRPGRLATCRDDQGTLRGVLFRAAPAGPRPARLAAWPRRQ